MREKTSYRTKWVIRRYANDADYAMGKMMSEPSVIEGNVLLNEGINAMLTLLIGGTETAFNNANAYIGVGDSDTAASASQTGLQAVTNKAYKAMAETYPQVSGQTVAFRSVFGTSDANFDWKEFSVSNSNSDSGKNLNRKVDDQGTKVSGQTWTMDLEITFS